LISALIAQRGPVADKATSESTRTEDGSGERWPPKPEVPGSAAPGQGSILRLITLIVLCSVAAQAADGGVYLDVERAQVTTTAHEQLLVGSGCYLSEDVCIELGGALKGKTARIAADEAAPDFKTLTIVSAVSLVVGVVLGAYLMYRLQH